ncbi:hypothetical protein BKA70DRAFT_1448775 [Coprinopsis sp. MPI-PUGE-AT-0042]|nr:hypothetical protein BKA70DRAFT_1448775 [Coprinopsis sp. MPI-PUGE-AT-0042]
MLTTTSLFATADTLHPAQQLKALLAKNRQLEDTEAGDADLIDALTGGGTLAVWDGVHHLWMCPTCLAEIDEAECILCHQHFEIEVTDEHSITVVSEAEHVDRLRPSEAPEPEGPALPLSHIPESWRRSEAEVAEYRQLIARGATPLMISTFSLRFTVEEGIVAHGDDTLFDEFSGPAMKDGDIWKIYLGNRVGLDPEDHDGSEFMEGLLEDAILFQQDSFRWETTKTGDGVWEMKPCKEFRKVWSDTDPDSDGENIEGWQEEDEADGGEWNSDSDDIGPSKYWESEGCLNDPASEEAIVVNRYYDTDDDHEKENEAEVDDDEIAPASVKNKPEDSEHRLLPDDAGVESGSDTAASGWDSEEGLSGDEVEMIRGNFRKLFNMEIQYVGPIRDQNPSSLLGLSVSPYHPT